MSINSRRFKFIVNPIKIYFDIQNIYSNRQLWFQLNKIAYLLHYSATRRSDEVTDFKLDWNVNWMLKIISTVSIDYVIDII